MWRPVARCVVSYPVLLTGSVIAGVFAAVLAVALDALMAGTGPGVSFVTMSTIVVRVRNNSADSQPTE